MIRTCRALVLGFAVCLAAGSTPAQEAPELTEQRSLQGHERDVFAVAFSPDGTKLATGSVDQTVKVWDIQTGRVLTTLKGHTFSVRAVTFSPTGKTLASAAHDGSIRVWDWAKGQALYNFPVKDRADGVAFSPDGQLLIGASGGTLLNPAREMGQITLWNTATRKEARRIEQPGYVASLAVSQDGKLAASGFSQLPARVWDLATGKQLAVLGDAAEKSAAGVAFSPDAKLLVTGREFQVKVWEVASGQAKQTLAPGPGNRVVKAVAVSPDGKVIAAASVSFTAPAEQRHRIHFWKLETGKLLATAKGHTDEVIDLAFSRDGKMLASASRDRTSKLWAVPAAD